MKNMMKKYDLFKIVGITILFVALLTWLIPVSQYTGNEMYVGDISRLGIANLFATGIYSLNTIMYQVTFLLVLGGFYGLLSSIDAYKTLINKIVKKLEGKEIVFVLVTSFAFAGLASITSDIYQMLIFVPFIITIISNLKMDKITALCTTFGSILIGRLGATYSPYAYNYLNSYFSIDFNSEIITKIAIFVLSYVLFNFFNFLHVKETLKNKKRDIIAEDKFAIAVEEKKTKNVVIIALCLTLIFMGVGFAILSQNLTISTTGTISSSWDVHYDSFVDNTATGITATETANEGNVPADGITLDDSKHTATVKFNLVKPGDAVQYKAVIKNYGSIKAGLTTFSTTLKDNEFITRTVTINGTDATSDTSNNILTPTNVVLRQNDTIDVVVTYRYNDVTNLPPFNKDVDSDGKNDAYEVTDTITFGFVQK